MGSERGGVLATICARGGSQGISGKNLRSLGGRPLIGHTIECAKAAREVDRIVISTDSDEIAQVAEACGVEVPFRRPERLASHEAPKLAAIRHAAEWVESETGRAFDLVLDLDVTTPLRAPGDIDRCVVALREGGYDAVITVYGAERNPYFNMVELEDGRARPVKRPEQPLYRRQDAPQVFSVSPAVFGFRREFLARTDYIYDGRVGVVELPPERAVDIDRDIDLRFAELLLADASVARA